MSSSSNINTNHELEEVLLIMEENPYSKSIPELKIRFWDMFVIDAFISNNDRNEGNWGLILNKETNELRLSPIFDNGASFYVLGISFFKTKKICNKKRKSKSFVV